MYIIAYIDGECIYSKEGFIATDLEIAKAKLKTLRKNGDVHSKIYQVTDLQEVKD